MSQIYDVVIVGAGPAGLAAGVYTGRARLNPLLLERATPGGQILLTDIIENYPGFPDGIAPVKLMENFRKQAERFGARVRLDEVREFQKRRDGWNLRGNKSEYSTHAVIIATGSSYRKLGIEGEGTFTGRGVSYCATCDGAFFKDKEIAVVGGGNWALTEALFLTRYSRLVRIIHRRDQFRAERILQERVFKNPKTEVVWDSIIEKISGDDVLKSITLRNVKNRTTTELKLDGLFISIGTIPNSEFVKDLVELNEWREIKVKKNMATNQPGLYAAGDVTDACPQQMATAVGTGVSAAIAVSEYLGIKYP